MIGTSVQAAGASVNTSGGTAAPDGLLGVYYSNNQNTAGSYFEGSTATQIDPTVNFNPGTPIANTNFTSVNYSVRWTGEVYAPSTGTYTFEITTDDGGRLWVNGTELVDNWVDEAPTNKTATISLTAGHWYSVEFDMYQHGGASTAGLYWIPPGGSAAVIPTADLRSSEPDLGTQGLVGTYYSTDTFDGTSVTELDPTVNFNWNGNSPVSGIAGTNFSVRWVGQIYAPTSGTYTFTTTSDDGRRPSGSPVPSSSTTGRRNLRPRYPRPSL